MSKDKLLKLTDTDREALSVIKQAHFSPAPVGVRPTVPSRDNWLDRSMPYTYVKDGKLRHVRVATANKLISAGLIRADYEEADVAHRFLKLFITDAGRAALIEAHAPECNRCQAEGDGRHCQRASFYIERSARMFKLRASGVQESEPIDTWDLDSDDGYASEYICKYHAQERGYINE